MVDLKVLPAETARGAGEDFLIRKVSDTGSAVNMLDAQGVPVHFQALGGANCSIDRTVKVVIDVNARQLHPVIKFRMSGFWLIPKPAYDRRRLRS